jgi:hypothetical protein
MPARKPTVRQESRKQVWLSAFVDELMRLRPHLVPEYGTSEALQSVAMDQWTLHADDDPAATAHAWHKGLRL